MSCRRLKCVFLYGYWSWGIRATANCRRLACEGKGKTIVACGSVSCMEIRSAPVSWPVSDIFVPTLACVFDCGICIVYDDWVDSGRHAMWNVRRYITYVTRSSSSTRPCEHQGQSGISSVHFVRFGQCITFKTDAYDMRSLRRPGRISQA